MSEEEPIAQRVWHTRAMVRVLTEHKAASVDPYLVRTFRVGEEIIMIQWGLTGREVDRSAWWDSFDIDGAFIIPANKVEVVKILDEVLPFGEETR